MLYTHCTDVALNSCLINHRPNLMSVWKGTRAEITDVPVIKTDCKLAEFFEINSSALMIAGSSKSFQCARGLKVTL